METLLKTQWLIDTTHSEITFKVKHLMISSVKGAFRKFNAEVSSKGESFSDATVDLDIDVTSIDTGDTQRDAHLRGVDFLDAEKFPNIHFKTVQFENTGSGNYNLTGNLTMHGVTKPVQLKAELGGIAKDPWGNKKAGFTVEGVINRKDWDLNWNAALEAGGVLVSEEVKVVAEIQLIKQAA
jgi:polyisoprenoid-binding protein YceI